MTANRNAGAGGSASPPSGTIRSAAFLLGLSGVGIAATTPLALWSIARTGMLPITPFGFRMLAGPFEQLGSGPFIILGLVLVGVSILDVIAAILLWQGRRRGAALALTTSPLLFALGIGFAVPFMLVTAPVRAGLVIAGRSSLR